MNEHVGCKHPCLYRFLENIIEIQGVQEFKIAKIEAGEEPEQPKRRYRDFESRLKKMVDGYKSELDDEELTRYVRSIATVLKFDFTVRKSIEKSQELDEKMEEEDEIVEHTSQ